MKFSFPTEFRQPIQLSVATAIRERMKERVTF